MTRIRAGALAAFGFAVFLSVWELAPALGLGLIGACLLGEAAVLRIGIDDLDEGYFVQQAARVLHGQVPYRDFQTLYTPGLVSLHALIFSTIGGPYVLAPRAVALGLAPALGSPPRQSRAGPHR